MKIFFGAAIFILCFAQEPDSLQSRPCRDTVPACPNLKQKRIINDSWLSQDKFLHFSACASITGLTYHVYTCRFDGDEDRGKVYSISLAALVGLSKELYDKNKKGHFSWKDLCWDGLGLAFGYFAFIHEY